MVELKIMLDILAVRVRRVLKFRSWRVAPTPELGTRDSTGFFNLSYHPCSGRRLLISLLH